MLASAVRATLLVTAVLLFVPGTALAAVSVSRAELNGGQLRVEGRGAVANATITVTSPESTATGRADGSGNFRVEASSFRSSTCRVTVTDGATSASATLSGCSTSTTTTPPPDGGTTTPPPSTCTITPGEPATYHAGDLQTYYVLTTGCRTAEKPVQWSRVSGTIPPGMSGPHTQGVSSGFITGRPTTEGTYTFTLRVRDQTGAIIVALRKRDGTFDTTPLPTAMLDPGDVMIAAGTPEELLQLEELFAPERVAS